MKNVLVKNVLVMMSLVCAMGFGVGFGVQAFAADEAAPAAGASSETAPATGAMATDAATPACMKDGKACDPATCPHAQKGEACPHMKDGTCPYMKEGKDCPMMGKEGKMSDKMRKKMAKMHRKMHDKMKPGAGAQGSAADAPAEKK